MQSERHMQIVRAGSDAVPDGNNINSWEISSGISIEDRRLLFV